MKFLHELAEDSPFAARDFVRGKDAVTLATNFMVLDQDAFNLFFKALKPGGTLGVVEHRLPEARADADMKTSGYMKVSYVKMLAEKAGFKLAASSEINANAKDKANYPKGVWTLPPNYAEGEADKAKYAAIGESDRMTLKFVKPKK